MKILLQDFNSKVGGEGIFKPAIRNESLHEINNDNGVSSELCHIRKSVMSAMFPQCNIHKFTWTSDRKKQSQTDHVYIDKRQYSSRVDV
jgi:hypothetical protein